MSRELSVELQGLAAAAATARAEVRAYEMPEGLEGAPFETAYAFQEALVAATNARVGGHKLAVNGAPQMAHFGVSDPAAGRILADEMYESDAVLHSSRFQEIGIEPELAAVMGPGVADLDGPVDRATAMAAIVCFRPAIELIDQRGVPMPKVELAQAIAVNVFNAGIVLGRGSIAPDALDLDALEVTLDLDGARVGTATGAAPQHPCDAVAWLIGHLARRGQRLDPGMVVMCGTHLPLRVLDPEARQVEVTMGGLGRVGFTVAA
ncbi:2-keto-4-pentenoate hydratase [Antarcticimicrobium sediminis]|nr:fumarylacetoacetate hydrolase family protein [Antarcticimicrobium sediminis]